MKSRCLKPQKPLGRGQPNDGLLCDRPLYSVPSAKKMTNRANLIRLDARRPDPSAIYASSSDSSIWKIGEKCAGTLHEGEMYEPEDRPGFSGVPWLSHAVALRGSLPPFRSGDQGWTIPNKTGELCRVGHGCALSANFRANLH